MINIVNAIASFFTGIVKRIHFENGFSNVTNEYSGVRLDSWLKRLMIQVNACTNSLMGITIVTDITVLRVDLTSCTMKQLALAMPNKCILCVKNVQLSDNPNFPISVGFLIGFKEIYAAGTIPFLLIHATRGFWWTAWHPTDIGAGVWNKLGIVRESHTWNNCNSGLLNIAKLEKLISLSGNINNVRAFPFNVVTPMITLNTGYRPLTRIDMYGYIKIDNSDTTILSNLIVNIDGTVTLYVPKPEGSSLTNIPVNSSFGLGLSFATN